MPNHRHSSTGYEKLGDFSHTSTTTTLSMYDHLQRPTSNEPSCDEHRSPHDPLPSIRMQHNLITQQSVSSTIPHKPFSLTSGAAVTDMLFKYTDVSSWHKLSSSGIVTDPPYEYADTSTWHNKPWFHGDISRSEGENRIRKYALNMLADARSPNNIVTSIFLVRSKPCENKKQLSYAITVAFNDRTSGRMMVEHHIAEQPRRRDGSLGTHFVIDRKINVKGTNSISQLVSDLIKDSKGFYGEAISGRPGALLQTPCPIP